MASCFCTTPWCWWSSFSLKEVARLCAGVFRCKVRDRRPDEDWTYNWVSSASYSELLPEDRIGNTPLRSSLTRFAGGLFSVRTGGFAKSGRQGTYLLEVLEGAEVPGLESSSSWSR